MAILAVATVVRVVFFTGLALGDDVIYAPQSMVFALGKGWPPQLLHWCTRIGLTIPTSLFIRVLGPIPLAFVVVPFVASLASIWLSYTVAAKVGGQQLATTVGILHACFPLEVIYATHLFPDLPVGVMCAAAVCVWWGAVRRNDIGLAVASGALVGAAYLVRETAFMCAPVFLVLLLLERPRSAVRLVLACAVPFFAVIAAESALYAVTAHDALYRWRAIAGQQNNPGNVAVIAGSLFGGGFWSDPLLMIVGTQDFGLYMVVAVLGAAIAMPDRRFRPLALWLLVGFVWSYYGTTVPWRWLPLAREPRYTTFLTLPIMVLTGVALHRLTPRMRYAATGLIAASGILCASLDQGPAVRAPHAALLQAGYSSDLVLEPFEYYATWWERGLRTVPPFYCATDVGRQSMVTLFATLSPSQLVESTSRTYLALSPDRRPDLYRELTAQGWTVVRELPGRPTLGRRLAAGILARIPTQQARAQRILHPAGLIVLRNPATPGKNGAQS